MPFLGDCEVDMLVSRNLVFHPSDESGLTGAPSGKPAAGVENELKAPSFSIQMTDPLTAERLDSEFGIATDDPRYFSYSLIPISDWLRREVMANELLFSCDGSFPEADVSLFRADTAFHAPALKKLTEVLSQHEVFGPELPFFLMTAVLGSPKNHCLDSNAVKDAITEFIHIFKYDSLSDGGKTFLSYAAEQDELLSGDTRFNNTAKSLFLRRLLRFYGELIANLIELPNVKVHLTDLNGVLRELNTEGAVEKLFISHSVEHCFLINELRSYVAKAPSISLAEHFANSTKRLKDEELERSAYIQSLVPESERESLKERAQALLGPPDTKPGPSQEHQQIVADLLKILHTSRPAE